MPSAELRAPEDGKGLVAVFASRANEAWYEDMRWDYQYQIDTIFDFAKEAGYECVEVSEDDIGILPYVAEYCPPRFWCSQMRDGCQRSSCRLFGIS